MTDRSKSRAGDVSATRWDDRVDARYREWLKRVRAAEYGHRRGADSHQRRHLMLGIPVVVLSTMVGTSAFASLQDERIGFVGLRIAVGVIGTLAAVLSSLQTFLGYAQRSERHRVAAIRYETLRRKMEHTLAAPRENRRDAQAELASVRERMDKYGKESPQIGVKVWASLEKKYGVDTGRKDTKRRRSRSRPAAR
jgi:hypothetical protein